MGLKLEQSRCHLKSCAVYIGLDPTTVFFVFVSQYYVTYYLNGKQREGNFLHELFDSLEIY